MDLDTIFQTRAAGLLSLRDQHLYIPNLSKDGHCVPIDSSDCCHWQEDITGQDNFVGAEGDTNTVEVPVAERDGIRILLSTVHRNTSQLLFERLFCYYNSQLGLFAQ
jgi:hypothetical protein